jgi:hypothetical protein
MDLLELGQGQQDHIFGDGDSQLRRELAGNFLRCALAITSAPHKRGALIKAVGLVPHFVVDQNFIRQLANDQAVRAETRKLRMGCSLHRFSCYEWRDRDGLKRLSQSLNAFTNEAALRKGVRTAVQWVFCSFDYRGF